uniref:Uncharacterized protein n=1 Tax=Anguilla anguilla TaxID=7936 RepID=A0A0E9QDT0_ANGAN
MAERFCFSLSKSRSEAQRFLHGVNHCDTFSLAELSYV